MLIRPRRLLMQVCRLIIVLCAADNKRMRLHFNKIGYQIYGKEQSRRVPSARAKPGNPGYGFRQARWRDTLNDESDRLHCEALLRT
jgi:hypothetical protein